MNLNCIWFYWILEKWETGQPRKRMYKGGRNHLKLTSKHYTAPVKAALYCSGTSTQKLGWRIQVTNSQFISKILKKMVTNYRKRKNSPKYKENQFQKAKQNCNTLWCHISTIWNQVAFQYYMFCHLLCTFGHGWGLKCTRMVGRLSLTMHWSEGSMQNWRSS